MNGKRFSGVLASSREEFGYRVVGHMDSHEARAALMSKAGVEKLPEGWYLTVWEENTPNVVIDESSDLRRRGPRKVTLFRRRLADRLKEVLAGGEWVPHATVLESLSDTASKKPVRDVALDLGVEMRRGSEIGLGGTRSYWRLPAERDLADEVRMQA